MLHFCTSRILTIIGTPVLVLMNLYNELLYKKCLFLKRSDAEKTGWQVSISVAMCVPVISSCIYYATAYSPIRTLLGWSETAEVQRIRAYNGKNYFGNC